MVLGLAAVAGAQSGSEPPASTSAALPKDIDPQSFSRLPVVKRDDLDEDGKRIYDMLAGGEGKTVTPTGPAAISLYSPKVAESIQMLNQYLRFHGVLKPRDFEVAILVAAREFDQQYEWSGHEMGRANRQSAAAGDRRYQVQQRYGGVFPTATRCSSPSPATRSISTGSVPIFMPKRLRHSASRERWNWPPSSAITPWLRSC